MTINFDHKIPLTGSNSVKLDERSAYFGSDDELPLWVADMDFASPATVTKALAERAAHIDYGDFFKFIGKKERDFQ